MLSLLRKRLILLYTATTGVILTAVLIGVLFSGVNAAKKEALRAFQDAILTVSSHMQFGQTVSSSFLARTEAQGRLIIHIEENGSPFFYHGSWTPATDRRKLVALAREKALTENVDAGKRPISSSVIRSSIFTVQGDHSDSYYANVMILPTSKGFQSLILLNVQQPYLQLIRKQAPPLVLLHILGVLALFFVSRHFVAKSLEPVEKSRKRQADFIASASHELRSPLAVIQASVSAIRARPVEEAQFLDNIQKECERMSMLVGDMLLLASSDAGRWSISPAPVDVDTLLIGTYERYEPVCRQRGVRFLLSLPEPPLPPVTSDEARLSQILSILLDNAVRYTPAGRSIALKGRREGRYLVLEVADEGCGIPDEKKEHIFDRFYRGDESRTDKDHFGLGLSIAKELTVLLRGQITVTDTISRPNTADPTPPSAPAPGGSRFLMRFPI